MTLEGDEARVLDVAQEIKGARVSVRRSFLCRCRSVQ